MYFDIFVDGERAKTKYFYLPYSCSVTFLLFTPYPINIFLLQRPVQILTAYIDVFIVLWHFMPSLISIRYGSTIGATSNESSASETVNLETVAFSCWSWRFRHIKWSNGSYCWIATQWFKVASDLQVRGMSNLYFHSIKTWLILVQSFHSLMYSPALYL